MSTNDSAPQKIAVGSLDDSGLTVEAQFNPKELQIDKSVPWQKHNKANANGLQLEFTGAEGRSMSLELLFDGYESGDSVADKVEKLNKLATVQVPSSATSKERRPHHCFVTWGTLISGAENKFKCVIESISTKYTMFKPDGTPLRATVTLKLKEADRVSMAKASSGGGAPASGSSNGSGQGR